MESRRRSLAKAISYRCIALLLTFLVALVASGRVELAAGIGLADAVLKIFFFYLHERLWNRVDFGRRKEPEYNI